MEKNRQEYRKSTSLLEVFILVTVLILIVVAVGRNVLISPGIPLLAEQIESYDEDDFIEKTWAWDEGLSINSVIELPKIFLYHFIYYVSKVTGFEITIKLFLILPHAIGFLTCYYLIRKIFFSRRELLGIVIAIAISVVYAFNPWIAYRSRNIILRWQYATIPLLMYLWIAILRNDVKYAIYSLMFAVLFTMVETPRFVFKIILPLLVTTLTYVTLSNRKLTLLKLLKRVLSTLCIIALLLGPVYLPLMYTSSAGMAIPIKEFTAEMISAEKPLNTFSLYITNYPGKELTSPYPPEDNKPFMFLFITMLALLSLLLTNRIAREKLWLMIGTLLLVVITLYLTMLGNAPFFTAVKELVFLKLPILGRAYRQSYHNATFLPFYIVVLLGFLFEFLYNKFNKKYRKGVILTALIIIILSSLTSSWVLLTGDLNGYWRPSKIPKDYKYANSLMRDKDPSRLYHALWLPIFGPKKAIWVNATSPYDKPPTGLFALRSSYLPTYLYTTMYFFDYYNPIGTRTSYRLLPCYSGLGWGKIYAPFNIKYLIIHYDVKDSNFNNKLRRVVDKLQNDTSLTLIHKGPFLSIFTINKPSPRIYVNPINIATDKGLIVHASLQKYIKNVSIAYVSQRFVRRLNNFDYILTTNSFHQFLTNIVLGVNGIVISPSKYVERKVEPASSWAYAYSVSSYEFQRSLYLKNIEWNWDFDYGFGLVFTWSKLHIPHALHISNSDLVISWTFNKRNECSLWRKYTPPKQFKALQIVTCYNDVLKVELYNSTWGWKVIKSPPIPINSDHAYYLTMKIQGINAHKVHIKIAEYNSNNELISIKYARYVGDGSFSWRIITFNYIPSNPDVSYIQVQIWHGHLTSKPLPNVILIDYIKIYDITRYAKHITLDIPFNVPKTNLYKLFIRYLENKRGGTIKIYLDDKPIAEIKTVGQLDRFVWRDLGTFKLGAGKHLLKLENVNGFNAVNIFVLMPADEYNRLAKRIENSLESKTIIYLLEAEFDMFRTNAKVATDINASNGKLLKLMRKGYAWQSFEIIKNGYYIIAVRLKGSASITIDSNVINISSNSLTYRYIGPIYLTRGNHTINVKALQETVYLDTVWIYAATSPNLKTDIDYLFETKIRPAKILGYTRIGLTSWRINVIANKSFMLIFAESFDPFWRARIYKNGEIVETVTPIPIYSAINGFWINTMGNLTIIIEYTLQEWFRQGIEISAVVFTLYTLYVLWNLGIKESYNTLVRDIRGYLVRFTK